MSIKNRDFSLNEIIMLTIIFDYNGTQKTIHPIVLNSKEDRVLVDCGYPGFIPLLEAELKSKNIYLEDLTKVFITHHDDDHMGALYELKEKYPHIKVVSSMIESDYISGKKKSLRLIQAEEMQKELPLEQKQFGIQFCEALSRVKPVLVDLKVKDGDWFSWGGGCRIIETPGHMPGHVSLYIENSNAVITGDAAVIENDNLVVANPQFAIDIRMAKNSLDKLMALKAECYYCYHGGKFLRKG